MSFLWDEKNKLCHTWRRIEITEESWKKKSYYRGGEFKFKQATVPTLISFYELGRACEPSFTSPFFFEIILIFTLYYRIVWKISNLSIFIWQLAETFSYFIHNKWEEKKAKKNTHALNNTEQRFVIYKSQIQLKNNCRMFPMNISLELIQYLRI